MHAFPAAVLLGLAVAAAPGPLVSVPIAAADLAASRRTYRLQGSLRVDAQPFPARDEEVHADAVLSPGRRTGETRVRLAAQGFTCELLATTGAAGTLALAAGQRCLADIREERAEGRVEARLVSGRGRVSEDALELELVFALSGSVRLLAGDSLEAIGKALSIPGAGGDPVPVRGQASAHAQGERDRSRAAQ